MRSAFIFYLAGSVLRSDGETLQDEFWILNHSQTLIHPDLHLHQILTNLSDLILIYTNLSNTFIFIDRAIFMNTVTEIFRFSNVAAGLAWNIYIFQQRIFDFTQSLFFFVPCYNQIHVSAYIHHTF